MSQPFHDSEEKLQMHLPPRLGDLWETEVVPQLPADLDEQARQLMAAAERKEREEGQPRVVLVDGTRMARNGRHRGRLAGATGL